MKDRNFARFVLPNVLAMVGTSCYVIADTYFISVAEGSDGIAALNLVLPLYGLLFALGSMTGTGSATRFALLNATGNAEGRDYFFNSVFWSVCLSFPFLVAGIFFPDKVLQLLGADGNLVMLGKDYTRIVLCFSPFFIVNYTFTAFVRNSGSPGIAMAATVVSGAFNIAADYVFMFPFGMGMGGAALATGISPVISIVICLTGLLKKRDLFRLSFRCVSFVKLIKSWSLGVSAFVGEISVSLTTLIFNFILLGLAGNTAVAAYGVISNTALVVTAMLSAIGYVLMLLNFSVPFMPSFIKLDISELPALIASFSLGPVYGVAVCLVKNLLNMLQTQTFGVGDLSNFLLGTMFVLPAGVIYQRMKSRKGALIGSLAGAVIMALGSVFTNIFLVYPLYYNFMSKEAILNAYQAILPAMKSVEQSIIVFNMPFTFLKAMLSVLVTFLIYKRISPIIKGVHK